MEEPMQSSNLLNRMPAAGSNNKKGDEAFQFNRVVPKDSDVFKRFLYKEEAHFHRSFDMKNRKLCKNPNLPLAGHPPETATEEFRYNVPRLTGECDTSRYTFVVQDPPFHTGRQRCAHLLRPAGVKSFFSEDVYAFHEVQPNHNNPDRAKWLVEKDQNALEINRRRYEAKFEPGNRGAPPYRPPNPTPNQLFRY